MKKSTKPTEKSTSSLFIEQLASGICRDPFAFLGIHAVENGVIIRAYLADAQAVTVIDETGKPLSAMEKIDERGFFAATLIGKKTDLSYRLWVNYPYATVDLEDPYRFQSHLSDFDHWLLAEGSHTRPYEKLGAHLVTQQGVGGIHFSLWAPNAKRVSVVGDFNLWDGRRHPMRYHANSGIWDIFIPNLPCGTLYKFELLDQQGKVRLKSDPYAFYAQFRPDTASVATGLPEKVEISPARRRANAPDQPISVYEVHLGSWRRNLANHYWLNYDEIAAELIPYVKEMGFTHIELLPISEYPFDGSWGYQPTGLYAPTSRFGDPNGLRRLIAQAHAAGINVILDWVVGHFPTDEHGLAYFDGTHLYEHADPKEGYHQDWNTLIFNYGRHEVQNYLSGNALYWVERFGIDALRVDAVASMIYRDYSRKDGEWIPNQYGGRENLEALDFLRKTNQMLQAENLGGATIAEESTAFAGITHPVAQHGLGFDYKWNMGWMNDTLRYISTDPIYRKYHHDLMTFGMVYQYSEKFMLPLSHDEVVHGKGSMLAKMPGDCWQKFANLRAYYGYMWGYPGKKLLFMGNEFAQGKEWNFQESLEWHLLGESGGGWHKGVQGWVRDLNRLYTQNEALYQLDYDPKGFEWRVVDDGECSVFAFERCSASGKRLMVVSNFTPVVRENYRIGVPLAGSYHEVLNSDAALYMGSNLGNHGAIHTTEQPSHNQPHSITLTLPPLCTLFLAFSPAPKSINAAKGEIEQKTAAKTTSQAVKKAEKFAPKAQTKKPTPKPSKKPRSKTQPSLSSVQ